MRGITDISENEKSELRQKHKQLRDRRECDRMKMVLMLSEGYSIIEISKILLLDEESIRYWRDKYLAGTNNWYKDSYRGYIGKYTELLKLGIKEYLSKHIVSDSKELLCYVKAAFDISYSRDGMVKLLHRLGYEYKHTSLIPGKIDKEAQLEFKKKYEELKSGLKEGEEIVFIDGVHPQHNTTTGKAWIEKGRKKEIKSNTGRQRINIQGAYNPKTNDIFAFEDKTFNADNTIDFFKKLEVHYAESGKLYVILDNARYYKNEKVQEFIKTSKLELLFLPAYSPNLNLIERLWKLLRREKLRNKYYQKFSDFRNAIWDFFDSQIPNKKTIADFVGNSMHLFS